MYWQSEKENRYTKNGLERERETDKVIETYRDIERERENARERQECT